MPRCRSARPSQVYSNSLGRSRGTSAVLRATCRLLDTRVEDAKTAQRCDRRNQIRAAAGEKGNRRAGKAQGQTKGSTATAGGRERSSKKEPGKAGKLAGTGIRHSAATGKGISHVRKRLISPIRSTAVVRESGWLDLDQAALVEVTSEAEGFPVEEALLGDGRGWRADVSGIQTHSTVVRSAPIHSSRSAGF